MRPCRIIHHRTGWFERGDIYTAATGTGFGGKPRPVLIIQSDAFPTRSKLLVALIGSPVEGTAPVRVDIAPDSANTLRVASQVMTDILLPVRPDQFGRHVGHLSPGDMRRVDQALLLFLGIGTAI